MARKLKMPAGGSASEQQTNTLEAPAAEPTVADQATALLESDESPSESEPATETAETVVETAIDPAQDVVAAQEISAAADSSAEPFAGVQVVEEAPIDAPRFVIDQSSEVQVEFDKLYRKWWSDFRQWETDVEAAKERHTAAAITQAQIKESHKIAKAAEEEALEELRDLLNDRPSEPSFAEFMVNFRKQTSVPTGEPTAADATQPAEPNTSTAWREVSITKLDLPAKLIERLQNDCINTIGQLEDRRGEISEHKAKWPKGIGAAKITQIEDAVIAWLTANRDQAAFQDLQSGHTTEQPTEQPTAEEVPTNTDAEATIKPDVTNEEFANAINARAVELDDGTAGCLDDQLKAGYWHQGYDHYEAGGELRACGLPPSPAQDDFIRGWLAAGQVEDWPDADEASETVDDEPPAGEEPELQEVAATESDGPQLFDPDNI